MVIPLLPLHQCAHFVALTKLPSAKEMAELPVQHIFFNSMVTHRTSCQTWFRFPPTDKRSQSELTRIWRPPCIASSPLTPPPGVINWPWRSMLIIVYLVPPQVCLLLRVPLVSSHLYSPTRRGTLVFHLPRGFICHCHQTRRGVHSNLFHTASKYKLQIIFSCCVTPLSRGLGVQQKNTSGRSLTSPQTRVKTLI